VPSRNELEEQGFSGEPHWVGLSWADYLPQMQFMTGWK
jgi:hypothetical protein